MNNYKQTTQQPPPIQQPSYADRMGLHTTEAGVKVPLLQALVTGILIAIVIGALIWLINSGSEIAWIIGAGSVVATVTWIVNQRRWGILTRLEYWLGDLNNDGYIGEPPKKVTITVNRVKEDQHLEQMQYDFPVSDQQIQRFFTTVKTSTRGGKPISRRKWTPKNVHGFSEGEWDAFYAELVKQRLVTVKGNECVLTEEGEEIADGWYSRVYAVPSPTDKDE